MSRPIESFENHPAYMDILFAIYSGKLTSTSIAKYLGKAQPTVYVQLSILEKEKLLDKTEKNYSINYKNLAEYLSKKAKLKANTKVINIISNDIQDIFSFLVKDKDTKITLSSFAIALKVLEYYNSLDITKNTL